MLNLRTLSAQGFGQGRASALRVGRVFRTMQQQNGRALMCGGKARRAARNIIVPGIFRRANEVPNARFQGPGHALQKRRGAGPHGHSPRGGQAGAAGVKQGARRSAR